MSNDKSYKNTGIKGPFAHIFHNAFIVVQGTSGYNFPVPLYGSVSFTLPRAEIICKADWGTLCLTQKIAPRQTSFRLYFADLGA